MRLSRQNNNVEILPGIEQVAEDFWQSEGGLYLPEYTRPARSAFGLDSVISGVTEGLHAPERFRDPAYLREFFGQVAANLDEIDKNIQIVEEDGDEFEISFIRAKGLQEQADGTLLHVSTYRSSILINSGNAFELAVLGALYPNMNLMYVGSPGNGGSSPIKNKEDEIETAQGVMSQRKYFRTTGRTTYEDTDGVTRPLPYVRNMMRAINKVDPDMEVTGFIGTDSAGGNWATGASLEMEHNQLKCGFFSERSNFRQLSPWRLAYQMLRVENMQYSRRMQDLRLDGEWVDRLSVNAPRIDDPEQKNITMVDEHIERIREMRDKGILQQLGALGVNMRAMATSLSGLSRGPRDGKIRHDDATNPLLADTNPMLARHPNAKLNYIMAREDALYAATSYEESQIEDEPADRLAKEFLAAIAVQNSDAVVTVLPSLPHAYHTPLPQLQFVLRNRLFGSAM